MTSHDLPWPPMAFHGLRSHASLISSISSRPPTPPCPPRLACAHAQRQGSGCESSCGATSSRCAISPDLPPPPWPSLAFSRLLSQLLWRDLEQGCTFSHLESQSARPANDDTHWRAHRDHVLDLISALAGPLHVHASYVKQGAEAYMPSPPRFPWPRGMPSPPHLPWQGAEAYMPSPPYRPWPLPT